MRAWRWGSVWAMVSGSACVLAGGCAAAPPHEPMAATYQVGNWRGVDAGEAAHALVRRSNAQAAPGRRLLHVTMPTMPDAAIEAGAGGTVDVRMRVLSNGAVVDLTVDGAPAALLAEAALAAVRQWRFEASDAADCWLVQRFVFTTLTAPRRDVAAGTDTVASKPLLGGISR